MRSGRVVAGPSRKTTREVIDAERRRCWARVPVTCLLSEGAARQQAQCAFGVLRCLNVNAMSFATLAQRLVEGRAQQCRPRRSRSVHAWGA